MNTLVLHEIPHKVEGDFYFILNILRAASGCSIDTLKCLWNLISVKKNIKHDILVLLT